MTTGREVVTTPPPFGKTRQGYGYGLFSLRLIGSAMFGATFNLATRVGVM